MNKAAAVEKTEPTLTLDQRIAEALEHPDQPSDVLGALYTPTH
jgi:hypothetical protein